MKTGCLIAIGFFVAASQSLALSEVLTFYNIAADARIKQKLLIRKFAANLHS